MPAPRRPDPVALAALGDDGLLDSARASREAGDAAAATLALELLIWRHLDDVTRRVALRVAPDLVEDVAHDVLVEAVDGAFGDPAIDGLRRRLDVAVRAAGRPRRAAAAAEHEDDDDLWGAGLLVALPAGEPDATDGELPESLREGLAAFAVEHRDGGDADPRAALAPVRDRDDRRALAAALDAFLAGASPRGWDAGAFAAAQRDGPMQRVLPRVVGSLGEGVEPWPRLLPRLRRDAGLSRRSLAARLAAALDLADRAREVERRYAAMEAGTVETADVADQVLDALADLLDSSPEVLRRASGGVAPTASRDGDDAVAALFGAV